ncbi:hypothetical protein LTR05_003061 [Lithohypha guttulata]|uniref:FAD-binding FR-type domain-containing protein n=2 Tax=Lithohypha guttulata TaxID=1690604 RepID=A0AAN7T498_9EURO|nr:hypothetical protein LTR05_003061 [Lithohypha guttulata]
MKKTITLTSMLVAVSAAGGYGSNPSGSPEQNQQTELYLAYLNKSLAENYLYALIALTALVFVYHSSVRVNNHIRHLSSLNGNPGSQKYFSTLSPTMAWMKDHILLAPLWHHRRAAPIKFSSKINLGGLPTRFQAIFISFVIIYNVFACVWNVPWSDPELQVLPILRNRTGTLATVNLIPIIIMSTIKNPLINALDISYDSFNLMHRWIGRLSILQGLAHTLCWMIAKVKKGGWPAVTASFTHSSFIYTGLIATVGFVVLGLQAPKMFRALAYEFFLHFHIALVAMTFAGLWIHLEAFPQLKYLLAAIVIWGATRLWRWATMFYRSFASGGRSCKAIIEALPGDAMRIEFLLPRPWKAQSGQTLYFGVPSVGWSTMHPFSVAWSETYTHGGLSRNASTKTTFTNRADPEKHTLNLPSSRARDMDIEGPKHHSFSLIVKKYDGFTRKLYEKAARQPLGTPLTISAVVEGPYGHAKSLNSYGTVLLFASGVGITHQMSYVRDLVQGYADGTVATKRMTLVWVVPDTECLEWVRPWMHEILGMDKRREVLRVLLYITRATLRQEIKSPSETVRMSRGRPDVLKIMTDAAREQIGCIGVSVCAGGGLADEVRRASRFVVGSGVNLDLIEEGFGW